MNTRRTRATRYTVDELAAATGMTVRTTRYYACLGLLPPPSRRGRMAYYTVEHRARLDLIRALQDHGFTLAAIEKYLGRVPVDASVEDLALQRAMLTSWGTGKRESITRRQLETRAGRKLGEEEIQRLLAIYAIREDGERYEPLPSFDVALELLDLDIPVDSMEEASEAINRHMDRWPTSSRTSCAPGCSRRSGARSTAKPTRPPSSRRCRDCDS